jgi:hypothetical protein
MLGDAYRSSDQEHPMNHPVHSLVWRGALYRFQRLRESATQIDAFEYAVACAGEFMGVMTCPGGLTTREFIGHCFLWLGEQTRVAAGGSR